MERDRGGSGKHSADPCRTLPRMPRKVAPTHARVLLHMFNNLRVKHTHNTSMTAQLRM